MAEYRIVVLQRGWVVVGRYERVSDEEIIVHGAAVIRRWGTTKGLGELAAGPTKQTALDPCGEVHAHPLSVVLTVKAEADVWQRALAR